MNNSALARKLPPEGVFEARSMRFSNLPISVLSRIIRENTHQGRHTRKYYNELRKSSLGLVGKNPLSLLDKSEHGRDIFKSVKGGINQEKPTHINKGGCHSSLSSVQSRGQS